MTKKIKRPRTPRATRTKIFCVFATAALLMGCDQNSPFRFFADHFHCDDEKEMASIKLDLSGIKPGTLSDEGVTRLDKLITIFVKNESYDADADTLTCKATALLNGIDSDGPIAALVLNSYGVSTTSIEVRYFVNHPHHGKDETMISYDDVIIPTRGFPIHKISVVRDEIGSVLKPYRNQLSAITPANQGSEVTPEAALADDEPGNDAVIGGTNGGAVYTRSQFKRWLTANSHFHLGHTDTEQDETQYLYFDHNGSIAKATIDYPAQRSVENWTIVYEVPRPGMLEAGAKPGDVIFTGQPDLDTGALSGTSYIFNKKCGKFAFEVHEQNQNPGGHSRTRVLLGNAPIVDRQTCQVVRYKEVGLDFEELFDGIVVEKKE